MVCAPFCQSVLQPIFGDMDVVIASPITHVGRKQGAIRQGLRTRATLIPIRVQRTTLAFWRDSFPLLFSTFLFRRPAPLILAPQNAVLSRRFFLAPHIFLPTRLILSLLLMQPNVFVLFSPSGGRGATISEYFTRYLV